MNSLNLHNQQNQIVALSEQDLQKILLLSNKNTGETSFQAEKISEKIFNYLGIFLLNPANTLSQQQLIDLAITILSEQCLTETAHNFSEIFNNYQIHKETESSAVNQSYNLNIQEKLTLLYFGSRESHLSFEQLLEQLSRSNCPKKSPLSKKIFDLIIAKKFLPHHNLLKKNEAAFDHQILQLEDNLNDIFDGVKQLAINFQNNTATLVDFSKLRPKLSPLKSNQGVSTGPVSFIKIFTSSYEALRQNLQNDFNIPQTILLNIHHPDLLEYLIFIRNFQKHNTSKNFHFLIEITPAFRESLQKEEDFELINPQNNQVVNYLSAKNTFDLIISTIEENSQLGLINILESSVQPSLKNQTRISGIWNLATYADQEELAQEALIQDLQSIQDFLLIQQNNQLPPPTIQLNLTGLADLMIKLKISYASIQSIEFINQLIRIIKENLYPSIIIGTDLGSPLLPYLEGSPGLEMYDHLVISKTSLSGQENYQIIPELLKQLQQLNLTSHQIYQQIAEQNSLQGLYQIPLEIKALFFTNSEIPSQFHLNLQQQFENGLSQAFNKKIYLDNNLDQDSLKKLIIEFLLNQTRQFRHCTFKQLLINEEISISSNPIIQSSQDKNFLHNLNKHRRRRSQQIQPPLFQIKKTEEVSLPPINSNQHQK